MNADANANTTTDREIATQQRQVPPAQQIQSNTSAQKQKQMPTTVQAPPPAAAAASLLHPSQLRLEVLLLKMLGPYHLPDDPLQDSK